MMAVSGTAGGRQLGGELGCEIRLRLRPSKPILVHLPERVAQLPLDVDDCVDALLSHFGKLDMEYARCRRLDRPLNAGSLLSHGAAPSPASNITKKIVRSERNYRRANTRKATVT